MQEKTSVETRLYQRQNRAIHQARNQLGLSLEDCRELAERIGGTPSLSGLTVEQRWELIAELKEKGANVVNPAVEVRRPDAKEYYGIRLSQWNKRFPRRRPGYASNKQLAWIEAMWELDFRDHSYGKNGLRGFIRRQTINLLDGPVSDLAFLREHHVEAVITPLKERARQNQNAKPKRRKAAVSG